MDDDWCPVVVLYELVIPNWIKNDDEREAIRMIEARELFYALMFEEQLTDG